jgi:hypothetical protein
MGGWAGERATPLPVAPGAEAVWPLLFRPRERRL